MRRVLSQCSAKQGFCCCWFSGDLVLEQTIITKGVRMPFIHLETALEEVFSFRRAKKWRTHGEMQEAVVAQRVCVAGIERERLLVVLHCARRVLVPGLQQQTQIAPRLHARWVHRHSLLQQLARAFHVPIVQGRFCFSAQILRGRVPVSPLRGLQVLITA